MSLAARVSYLSFIETYKHPLDFLVATRLPEWIYHSVTNPLVHITCSLLYYRNLGFDCSNLAMTKIVLMRNFHYNFRSLALLLWLF